jgi:hypothetical protein
LHVAAGITGLVISARLIWLSRDRPRLDRGADAYHWSVAAIALTWGLAADGHVAPLRRFPGWRSAYAHGLGGSYIALVTALLVVSLTVNGPVDGMASALVWGLPTLVGTLLVVAWHRRLRRPSGGRVARSPHPSGPG